MASKKMLPALCAVMLGACSPPLADRFQSIRTGLRDGTSRTEVVALVGPPTSTHAGSFAGADAEWAEWRDGKSGVYTVVFFQGKAVLKTAHPTNHQEK